MNGVTFNPDGFKIHNMRSHYNKWSVHQKIDLMAEVHKIGTDWFSIAAALNRTYHQCYQTAHYILKSKPMQNEIEEQLCSKAMGSAAFMKFVEQKSCDWGVISIVVGAPPDVCEKHWRVLAAINGLSAIDFPSTRSAIIKSASVVFNPVLNDLPLPGSVGFEEEEPEKVVTDHPVREEEEFDENGWDAYLESLEPKPAPDNDLEFTLIAPFKKYKKDT